MEQESLRINSIEEIEKKLAIVGGDMVKIEFLEENLRKNLPLEVKKYAHIKLSELYTKRLMLGVAAKNMESAAETAITFKEKKELHMKQIGLLVQALSFDDIEKALKKAMMFANTKQEKDAVNSSYKKMLLDKAASLEKIQNMKKASEVYERLNFLEPHNLDFKKKLIILYNRLGKIKEAIALEHSLKNPQPVAEEKKEFNMDEFLNS